MEPAWTLVSEMVHFDWIPKLTASKSGFETKVDCCYFKITSYLNNFIVIYANAIFKTFTLSISYNVVYRRIDYCIVKIQRLILLWQLQKP